MTSILDNVPGSFCAIIVLWFSLVFWNLSNIRLPELVEVVIGIGFTIMNIILFLRLEYDLKRDGKKDEAS